MCIDLDILKDAIVNILADVGNLKGLPKEIANTAINIYYAHEYLHQNIYHLAAGYKNPEQFAVDAAFLKAALDYMPEEIKILKNTHKTSNAKTCKICDDLFLDTYKYRISNITKKSPARRTIERKISKNHNIDDLLFMANELNANIY